MKDLQILANEEKYSLSNAFWTSFINIGSAMHDFKVQTLEIKNFDFFHSAAITLWTNLWRNFFKNFEIMASMDRKFPETYFGSVKVP